MTVRTNQTALEKEEQYPSFTTVNISAYEQYCETVIVFPKTACVEFRICFYICLVHDTGMLPMKNEYFQ